MVSRVVCPISRVMSRVACPILLPASFMAPNRESDAKTGVVETEMARRIVVKKILYMIVDF